jgi:hypothetical protein
MRGLRIILLKPGGSRTPAKQSGKSCTAPGKTWEIRPNRRRERRHLHNNKLYRIKLGYRHPGVFIAPVAARPLYRTVFGRLSIRPQAARPQFPPFLAPYSFPK